MELDRGVTSKQISSTFYGYRNGINIYTEDNQKDKKFYVTLLKRLLNNENIKINDVFPLGDCDMVYNACKKDKSNDIRLYIIDGDIFQMTDSKKKVIDHLFILNGYCIENFIIDENSYYKTYDELDSAHNMNEIKSMVDFYDMMNQVVTPFLDLFRHFAVSQDKLKKFRLKDATQMLSKNGVIDMNKINKEKENIKNDILNDVNTHVSDVEFEDMLSNKKTLYDDNIPNLLKYVSGKDYLIPYIVNYTKYKLKFTPGLSKEFWKYQFAKYCDLSRLEPLKIKIMDEVNTGGNNNISLASS